MATAAPHTMPHGVPTHLVREGRGPNLPRQARAVPRACTATAQRLLRLSLSGAVYCALVDRLRDLATFYFVFLAGSDTDSEAVLDWQCHGRGSVPPARRATTGDVARIYS